MFKRVVSFNVKDNNMFPCLGFSITYRNASVLCQSDCSCLYNTVNMVVFFVISNENTYPKRRAQIQMYRVVPIKRRGILLYLNLSNVLIGTRPVY